MSSPSKRTRQWLLTVASASALMPSCAEEHQELPIGFPPSPDDGQPIPDAGPALGVVVNPPDAGLVSLPDTGAFPGTVAVPVDTNVGIVVNPPDAGIVVLPDGDADAGVADASGGDAGAKDAGCPIPVFINGIIVAPPDASCVMPPYPGIMPRNVDGD